MRRQKAPQARLIGGKMERSGVREMYPRITLRRVGRFAITVKIENNRRYHMNNKPNNMPGFDAEASLGPTLGIYRGNAVLGSFPSEGSGGVMPQLGIQSDPDLGAYWRCRANGGS